MMKEQIAELVLIRKNSNNGLLKPKDVVAFAEDSTTALHNRFEWDDTKAGYQYRLWQARQMIEIVFDIIPTEKGNVDVRTYISLKHDRSTPEGGYREMKVVLSDRELRQQLLDQALEELKAFQVKYKDLQELANVFRTIKKVTITLENKGKVNKSKAKHRVLVST